MLRESTGVKYRRPGGGTLFIADAAWRALLGFRQMEASDLEAGGILLGRLIRDVSDVIVDSISHPGIADRRERTKFWRGKASTQAIVDRAWADSGGTRVYLGEWHSHPEDDPRRSPLDRDEQGRIVRNARYEQRFLFFAIVGRRVVRVWEGSVDGRFNECALVP